MSGVGGGNLERVGAAGADDERDGCQIGRRNVEQVEVLEGLKPGERVITSDYTGFEKVERVVLGK